MYSTRLFVLNGFVFLNAPRRYLLSKLSDKSGVWIQSVLSRKERTRCWELCGVNTNQLKVRRPRCLREGGRSWKLTMFWIIGFINYKLSWILFSNVFYLTCQDCDTIRNSVLTDHEKGSHGSFLQVVLFGGYHCPGYVLPCLYMSHQDHEHRTLIV